MKKLFAILGLALLSVNIYPEWLDFPVRAGESLWASSSLAEITGDKTVIHSPEALFDSNTSTQWVEGTEGDGTGEFVVILTQKPVKLLEIVNGNAKSPLLYSQNNRVKSLAISFLAGFTGPGMVTENDNYLYLLKEFPCSTLTEIKDISELQKITFPFTQEE